MRRRAGIVLAMLAALAAALPANEWDEYTKGEDALRQGDCATAAARFAAAASADGTESARKNPYGMRFYEYYPHLRLAQAWLCAGRGDRALEALQESATQGVAPAADVADVKVRPARANAGADELVWKARQALRSGDAMWARALLQQAAARAPRHAGVLELGPQIDSALSSERRRAQPATAPPATIIAQPTPIAAVPAPGLPSPAARSAEVDRILTNVRAHVRDSDLATALLLARQALALDSSRADVAEALDEIGRALATRAPRADLDAPVPPIFADAMRAYYDGKYDEALVRFDLLRPTLSSRAAYHLFVGASYYSKYLLAGSKDETLRSRALESFRTARLLAPDLEPSDSWLSPRVIEAYQQAR